MLTSLSGLRPRLMLLVLLAVLPATAILVIASYSERERLRSEAQENLQAVVRLISDSHELRILGVRDVLVGVAQSPELLGDDLDACSARLTELYALYPTYTGFGVFDLNGDAICASSGPPTAIINVADRPYFRTAITTRGFVDRKS